MKRILLTLTLIILTFNSFAQDKEYKQLYIIVPIKFDFFNSDDSYRLNTLTRHLFNQNGFRALFDVEELPKELFKDRCKALYVDVVKFSGIFKTKLEIHIKDCRGNLVAQSHLGTSKEKEYKIAYHEAISNAFKSIDLKEVKKYYENQNSSSQSARLLRRCRSRD